MTTKNEYIASIMLEAADLLKNDTESLNEAFGNSIRKQYKADLNAVNIKDLYINAVSNGTTENINKYIQTVKSVIKKYSNDKKALLFIAKDMEYAINILNSMGSTNFANIMEKRLLNPIKSSLGISGTIKSQYRSLKREYKKEEKNQKKTALQEAIDLLYDKAILCEDAAEAEGYVQKAEELQKAIEDIPEETPVKQDEYETSVVGGDDEKPDLDEIKDLCDNDPEVVKLLTDDEDKSVTVDSDGETNTESYGWFY